MIKKLGACTLLYTFSPPSKRIVTRYGDEKCRWNTHFQNVQLSSPCIYASLPLVTTTNCMLYYKAKQIRQHVYQWTETSILSLMNLQNAHKSIAFLSKRRRKTHNLFCFKIEQKQASFGLIINTVPYTH